MIEIAKRKTVVLLAVALLLSVVPKAFGAGQADGLFGASGNLFASEANTGRDVSTYGLKGITKVGSASRFGALYGAPDAAARIESNLILQNTDITLGKIRAKLQYQDVGLNFNGFAALRNSKAAPEDVLTQLEQEKGLKRMGVALQFGQSASPGSFYWNTVNDGGGKASRTGFNFRGKSFELSGFRQSIDASFARLSSLTSVEKLQFGAEQGMDRTGISGMFKFGGGLQAALDFSKVSDTNGGITKQSIELRGKSFNVKAKLQDVDPTFTRFIDLADPEKLTLQLDRGYKSTDISGAFSFGSGLNLQSRIYDAKNATAQLARKQLYNRLTFVSRDKSTNVTALSDTFSYTSSAGNISSYAHRLLSFDRHFRSGLYLSGIYDINEAQTGVAAAVTTTTRTLYLNTDEAGKKKTRVVANMKMIGFNDGKYENTTNVSIRSVVLKKFALTGDLTRKSTSSSQDMQGMNLTVNGNLFDSLALFRGGKLSASIGREELAGNIKSESKAAKFEAGLAGGALTMEYSGQKTTLNTGPTYTSYRFASNQDAKKRVRFDLFYKNRDDGVGKPMLVQAYNLDARINSKTKLIYNCFTFTEAATGIVTPVGGELLRLTSALRPGNNLVAEYKKDESYLYQRKSTTISVGISGKLDSGSTYELGLGRSKTSLPAGTATGNSFRLKYNRAVNSDHFLIFSAAVTKWDNSVPGIVTTDEVEGRIDYQWDFDW